MKGLLLKDYYVAVKYCRMHLAFVVGFSVLSLFIDMGVGYLFYPILFAGMIPVFILSVEEKCKWTQYVQTMPYSRGAVVGEKYIFTLLSVGVSGLFMTVLWLGRIALLGGSVAELLRSMTLVLALGFFFPAVTLPPMFRFGVEKGRFFTIAAAALLAVAVMIYYSTTFDSEVTPPEWLGAISAVNLPVLGLIVAVLLALSWLLARSLYTKREL